MIKTLPIRSYRPASLDVRIVFERTFAEMRAARPRALTAAADVANGAMIALVPTDVDLDRIVLDHPDAEPREQLHLTLAFLGAAADWGTNQREGLWRRIAAVAEDAIRPDTDEPDGVTGTVFGADYWNPRATGDQEPSWVLAVGGSELEWVHDLVWNELLDMRGEVPLPTLPEQHAPWVPHVCLAYSTDLGLIADMIKRVGPITFDRLRVAFGGVITDVPLTSPSTSAPPEATMSRTARLWYGAG